MKLFSLQKQKRKSGTSFVELIFYVSTFLLLMLVLVQITVTVSRSYKTIKIAKNLESSGLSAMDRMTRDIRNAINIDTGSSTFGSHPGELTLTLNDTPGKVRFYVSNNILKIDEDDVYAGPLTATGTSVTNLVFKQITTSNSKGVKIELRVESEVGNASSTKNFYGTGALRGSY